VQPQFVDFHVEARIQEFWQTFQENLAKFGRKDGYVVVSEALIYGDMVGG
jgi:hypothetical protein